MFSARLLNGVGVGLDRERRDEHCGVVSVLCPPGTENPILLHCIDLWGATPGEQWLYKYALQDAR
jgi:hypothetical protein